MVNEGKGCYFKTKSGKYLIYLPKELVEDTMFPFKLSRSMLVEIRVQIENGQLLIRQKVPRLC
jgi:hypothetical protein